MSCRLLAPIIFMLLFALAPTQAQQAESGLIDPNFTVPEHSGAVERLRSRFQALSERLRAMQAGQRLEGVDARLEELFVPDRPEAFRRRFRLELHLSKNGDDRAAWLKLAQKLLGAGRTDDAKAAAFHVVTSGETRRQQADALATMAEAYLAEGEVKTAINLYRKALETEVTPDRRRRFQVLIERYELKIKDIALDVEQQRPAACIVFSQTLVRRVRQAPEDYLTLPPGLDVDISARDNQICLRGLTFGARIEIEANAGIAGERGGRLYRTARRAFTVPDRAQRITFARSAYVLPRNSGEKLPVTTVNLDRAKLKLYRIGERKLAATALQNIIGQNINPGTEGRIASDMGVEVWQGEVELAEVRNTEVVTHIPLNEMFGSRKPGIYVLVGRQPEERRQDRWRPHATQWLVITDLGLTSLEGRDGLHVVSRSLSTADPVPETELTLLARNNAILGTATTNARGLARFAPGLVRGKGGDRPAVIVARRGSDHNFLRLVGSQLDLSERGVGGRYAPAGADAFIYAERGVYRPGETVYLSAMLRDARSKAMPGLPLTVAVLRPGGTEMYRKPVIGDEHGGYSFSIPIAEGARAGTWSALAYLDAGGTAIGRSTFQVEDFVPQRIAVELTTAQTLLRPGDTAEFKLNGQFLYGAPAADLKIESRLTLVRDTNPFPEHHGYHFGLVQETFRADRRDLKPLKTDASGSADFEFALDDLPDTSHPMVAELRSTVVDVGGRPVSARLRLPIRVRDVEVGLRPRQAGSLGSGEAAGFDIIALNPQDQPVSNRRLNFQWIREHYDYSWYQQGGRWQTRVIVTDAIIAAGEVTLDGAGRAVLERPLSDGRYRFEIADIGSGSAASHRFYVGWWRSSRLPDVPDALDLSMKSSDLSDGETLRAFVQAPFAGKALVAVMSNRLHHVETISLPKSGTHLQLPVKRDWGPGAYLMVSAYRPDDGKPSLLPSRAMGLAWFSIDKRQRHTTVSFVVPDMARPRQPMTLPLRVAGINASKTPLRLTVAAVDEGILRLTGYQTPDPGQHYLGQRRLGIEIRDLYGRLIRAQPGRVGRLRSGGDARLAEAELDNTQGPKTRTVKTVAIYIRDITLDERGEGAVTLDLPDFNGRLRLMAVAYGQDIVGSGEASLVVRDPLIADVVLPRFLAPGDAAEATLSVHNLSGRRLVVDTRLETSGGVAIGEAEARQVSLADQERRDIPVRLEGAAVGDGRIRLRAVAEGIDEIVREWDIAVRPAWSRVTRRHVTVLSPGQTLSGAGVMADAFLPGTAKTVVTVAARPDFDAPGMIDQLLRYPYGCTEQAVSRALPLLYAASLAKNWGAAADDLEIQRIVDHAVQRVLTRQRADGSFAVWQSFGKRHPWLSAYVFDFLTRARERGFHVPRAAYEHGQAWLQRFVARRGDSLLYAQAYGLYVLARIGAIRINEVRYFADTKADKIRTRLGIGHVAAALAILGEGERAEALFEAAIAKRRPANIGLRDYGSDLRDGASLASLLSETATGAARRYRLVEALERQFDRKAYLSTQEQAWLLLAAHGLSASNAEMSLRIDGEPVAPMTEPVRRLLTSSQHEGMEIENLGSGPVRVMETRRGVPSTPLPAVENGFKIRRSLFTTNGEAIDLSEVKQNDQIVILIEGEATLLHNHEALVVDMLPAGFEIENAAIGGDSAKGRFNFLPPLTRTEFEAARDDRYVAALDLTRSRRKFAIAYLVRAVTPGRFVMPASFVEDMYKPEYHARGETSGVTVHR